ncbi:MAG: hypothetical protein IID36_07950 [Planctomycetes bacterium]|nr:hypothetical protein [Planctomycetota bacterium]
MGDRAFDSPTGRFTQADVIFLDGVHPLAANRYVYASGDPVNLTDPTGTTTYTEQLSVTTIQVALIELSTKFSSGISIELTVTVNTGRQMVYHALTNGVRVLGRHAHWRCIPPYPRPPLDLIP